MSVLWGDGAGYSDGSAVGPPWGFVATSKGGGGAVAVGAGGRGRRAAASPPAGQRVEIPRGIPVPEPPSSRERRRFPACAARRADVTTAAIKARRARPHFLSAGAARWERHGAGEHGGRRRQGRPGGTVGRVRSWRPSRCERGFPEWAPCGGRWGRAGPRRLQ